MLVLMAIEDMLADLGCTSISVAGTLNRALHLIETQPFDLATLDINLNGQRSYPIAEALSAKHVPFAFSTGYGEHGVDQGFGHCAVLNKPYTEYQMLAGLTALVAPNKDCPPALAA